MSDPANNGNFELDLQRLEAIVKQLEDADLSLEQSLALFEEGSGLTRRLTATLDQAERRIELLVRGPEGDATTPFEPAGNAS